MELSRPQHGERDTRLGDRLLRGNLVPVVAIRDAIDANNGDEHKVRYIGTLHRIQQVTGVPDVFPAARGQVHDRVHSPGRSVETGTGREVSLVTPRTG